MTMTNLDNKGGFSLVEISLALLVAALGILSAFALFPEALKLSRKSVDATEISAFADYVFSSIQSMATSTDSSYWNDIKDNDMELFSSYGAMEDTVHGTGPLAIRTYDLKSFYWGGTFDNYVQSQFSYKLAVFPTVPPSPSGKDIVLYVWPAQQTNQPPVVFFRRLVAYF